MAKAANNSKTVTAEKCFACDRPLKSPTLVDTRDGQTVYVGPECFKKIKSAGDVGFQPALGGPRLFQLPDPE